MSGTDGTGGSKSAKSVRNVGESNFEFGGEQQMFNLAELEPILGKSRTYIRKELIQTGIIPAEKGPKRNGQWKVHRSHVEKYIRDTKAKGEQHTKEGVFLMMMEEFIATNDPRWSEAKNSEEAYFGFLDWAAESGYDYEGINEFVFEMEKSEEDKAAPLWGFRPKNSEDRK